jgi:hypothetical protein
LATSRSTTADRLLAIEERLAQIEATQASSTAVLAEIHVAVVGDGSAGSSLRERVATLETAHLHESSWKYRGVTTAATALVSAAFAYFTHLLSAGGSHS